MKENKSLQRRHGKEFQMELDLVADKRWIYFFSSMVSSGRLRDIRPNALAVLLVMKVNCDFRTNLCSISQIRLKKLTKLGYKSIKTAIETLEEFKYIEIIQRGNKHVYRLYDVIDFADEEKENHQAVQVPYIAVKREDAVHDLRDIEKLGTITHDRGTGTKIIQNFYFVNNGTVDNSVHNTVNNIDNSTSSVQNITVNLPEGIHTTEDFIKYQKWLANPAVQAIERMRLARTDVE